MATSVFAKRNFLLLSILLLLVLVFSLTYAFGFRIQLRGDARWYDTIAWNLASGKGFRIRDSGDPADDPAIAVVGPAYAYFLAGIYRIFGRYGEPVWIIQSLLHALNAFLVFLLAWRVLPDPIRRFPYSLLAASLYGLNPDLIQIAAMLFTETLFLTLLLLAAFGMAAFFSRPSAQSALATGVVLACAILVRPIALLPLGVFLILIVIKKRWWLFAAVLLIQVLSIGTWTARNYSVYGRFVLLTAAGGYNLWAGNNPNADGEEIPAAEVEDYRDRYGILEADRYGVEQYWKFLTGDPIRFLELQGIKTAKFFSAIRTSAWWFHLSGIARTLTFFISSPWFFVLLTFGLAGICLSFLQGPSAARILSLLALTVPAATIPLVVASRLRYPMYPFLAVLSSLTIFRYREESPPRRHLFLSCGFVLLMTLADIIISAPQIPERLLRLFS